MVEEVTILWSAATEDCFALLQAVARAEAATVIAVTIETLQASAVGAARRGGVVAVMAGGADATFAYRAGVDAVLLVGEMNERALRGAIGEARVRAGARLRHLQPASTRFHSLADVSEGLGLLTTILRDELGDRVFTASSECSGLHEEVRQLGETLRTLVGWAALIAPTSHLDALAKANPQAAIESVTRKLQRVEASIQRAEVQMQVLAELLAAEEQSNCVDAASVARLLGEPLVRHVAPWGELRMLAHDECVAAVPTPVFVFMISALIAHATQAIRHGVRSPGLIELRVFAAEHEATVIVEVFYSGPLETSFGPDVVASGGTATGEPAPVLLSLREHARQYGGDLLVDGDDLGMTARLLLPTPTADVSPTDRVAADHTSMRLVGSA